MTVKIEDLEARIKLLEQRLACGHQFCPDHRDKLKDKPCRQCEVEALTKSVDIAIDQLDPDMARWDIVNLRETLIRRKNQMSETVSAGGG
jgi:hypothetical protein